MGGGDLNLKKSWHPSTMKNMERVWKAEQRDTEEKKRIAELQREIVAERSREDMQKFAEDSGVLKKRDDSKLEWMYKGPREMVNNEDYLLGKSVDKNFEIQQRELSNKPSTSQESEGIPNAVRYATSSAFSEQVDLARKLNEDPLMAIRKRAVEMRQQLYNNPVKMKQIQQLVATSKSKKSKKEKKSKKKKSKKSHKQSESSDSNSSADEDQKLDALLAAKYSKLKGVLKKKDILKKIKDESDTGDDSDSDSCSERTKTRKSEGKSDRNKGETKIAEEKYVNRKSGSPHRTLENKKIMNSRTPHHSNHGQFRRSLSKERNRETRPRDNPTKGRKRSSSNSSSSPSRNDRVDGSKRRQKVDDRSESSGRQRGKTYIESNKGSKGMEFKKRERSPSNYRSNFKSKHKSQSPEKKMKTSRRSRSSSVSSGDSPRGRREKHGNYISSSHHRAYDSEDDERKSHKSYGLVMADGSKPILKAHAVVREEKKVTPVATAKVPQWKKPERKKLTEEELEQRRREMLKNASWRDKEREENVKRYRLEENYERHQHEKEFDKDFLTKQLSHATSQASVEGRIKSKLNNIQRSKMAMDKNFARR